MNEELKTALADLEKTLEGKSATEIKTAIKTATDKFEKAIKDQIEDVKTAMKTEFDAEVKTMSDKFEDDLKKSQDHLDNLDAKMKGMKSTKREGGPEDATDEIRKGIQANFEDIKNVRKGRGAEFEIKAVGNMVLANVTGDAERDFSNTVAKVPNQKVVFSDLIGTIPITGGTYTFPRESAGEGAIATQIEGADKAQRDYDFVHVDVATDFIAGFAVYSKKMANNVRYLEGFLPSAMRRDYLKSESSIFNTALIALATASAQVITANTKVGMIHGEIATLDALDHNTNAIVVTPADYHSFLQFEVSTGAGYGLPIGWTYDGGVLRCLGTPVVKANWLAANKYYVGDWSTISKVVTEGLSVQFSTEDEDNFRKNNITARVEAQVGLAVHRPDAVIYGDFTAV